MKPTSNNCRQAMEVLTEHLTALPIEVHLADDPTLIERCSAFLTNALQFWQEHRRSTPSVEALTTILSHDYHHVMKAGSREVRHLINIYRANREELKKVREKLSTDSSLDKVDFQSLTQLNEEGIEIDHQLSSVIDSMVTKIENDLDVLQKACIKLWNKSSVDASVIPKGIFFFISHATKDKEIALEITKELEAIGIATWRDDKDILGGDSIPTEIGRGLEKATHFGLLYTDTSKDRAWVKTEFENALMLREQTGRPIIIPLLLNGLRPPTILGNIKGVPFDKFQEGMELLWRSLGVPAGSRISLDILFKFQQKVRLAIEKVKWCHEANRDFEVDEEAFDDLEEIETYVTTFVIRGAGGVRRRFEWTVVSWPTNRPEELRPSFEYEFYSNRRTAIAGSSLLKSIGDIVRRLLAILDKIDEAPLPRAIFGGSQ